MKGWMIRWLLCIAALLLTTRIIPGFELAVWAAILGSVFLGGINAAIRPLLLLPRLFGLRNLIIATVAVNGIMMWVTTKTIIGFVINGLAWGLLTVLLFSLFSIIISYFISDDRKYWR